MNLDKDMSGTDEYFVTAHQIFDCCGVEIDGSVRADALIDRFAPFVKTNKAEFSYLKSLLDPEKQNPEINVTKLATALHKYSESQKTKMDLDESFNLKICGQVPQDSDSGISSDGLQLLEELQCELKEKEHLAVQLRAQLDYCDRQHEEALAALTCERDSLKVHLNMLREENASLSHVRRDYDEACERLCASETALGEARKELEALRRRVRAGQEQLAHLESDKLALQELLAKSKEECHHMNEMYATRQSALIEENETLKTEHADLTARYHDQDVFMNKIIKEKVQLEMELKDVLNKSNQTQLRMDRSIDVSYTDDQMLTALDTLNADSRFCSENRILDEDSFLSALKEDQGRPTNMSLFDEIRLSFCNVSRLTLSDIHLDRHLDHSVSNIVVNAETQTCSVDENDPDINFSCRVGKVESKVDDIVEAETQTDEEIIEKVDKYDGDVNFDFLTDKVNLKIDAGTQTDDVIKEVNKYDYDINLGFRVEKVSLQVNTETQTDEVKVEKCDSQCQTESKLSNKGVQTLGMMLKPRPFLGPQRRTVAKQTKKTIETQTCSETKKTDVKGTQTEDALYCNINNNGSFANCLECEAARVHKDKLEMSLKSSNIVMKEIRTQIDDYEENLEHLQSLIDEGKGKNKYLQLVVGDLMKKIELLQEVSEKQADVIEKMLKPDRCNVHCQTEFDQTSVSTQADLSCQECDKRIAAAPSNLKRFLWEPLKALFQLFAIVCFVCALCVLCGAARRGARGECRAAPWRWLDLTDVMDLLFRIEYTAEVPM